MHIEFPVHNILWNLNQNPNEINFKKKKYKKIVSVLPVQCTPHFNT